MRQTIDICIYFQRNVNTIEVIEKQIGLYLLRFICSEFKTKQVDDHQQISVQLTLYKEEYINSMKFLYCYHQNSQKP